MSTNITELIAHMEVQEQVEAETKAAYEAACIAAQAARDALAVRLGIAGPPRRGPGRPRKSEVATAARLAAVDQFSPSWPLPGRPPRGLRKEDEPTSVPVVTRSPEAEVAQSTPSPQKRAYKPRNASLSIVDQRAVVEAACDSAGETDTRTVGKAFVDLGHAKGSENRALAQGIKDGWLTRISLATRPISRIGFPKYVMPQCARYRLASHVVVQPLPGPDVTISSAPQPDPVIAPLAESDADDKDEDSRPYLIFVGQKEEQCRRLAENVGGQVEKWYDGSHPNIVTSDKTAAIIAITKFCSHNASAAALATGRKTGIPAILLPSTSDRLLRIRLVAAGVLEDIVADERAESGRAL